MGILMPQSCPPDALPLEVLMANRGEQEFCCGATGYLLDCVIKIHTNKGDEVPYSRQGSYLFNNQSGFKQYSVIIYQPGEIRHWSYDLADAFAPFEPGEYSLSLETTVRFRDSENRRFSRKARVVAKDIPFTIAVEKPDMRPAD